MVRCCLNVLFYVVTLFQAVNLLVVLKVAIDLSIHGLILNKLNDHSCSIYERCKLKYLIVMTLFTTYLLYKTK